MWIRHNKKMWHLFKEEVTMYRWEYSSKVSEPKIGIKTWCGQRILKEDSSNQYSETPEKEKGHTCLICKEKARKDESLGTE